MKKILLSLIALFGIFGMVNAATEGNGSKENPYTVDDIISLGEAYTQNGVWVKGYIVGTIPASAASSYLQYTEFSAKDASNTNLVLGGSSSEDLYQYCIPVQLPSAVRGVLSVQQNPDNIGHGVLLYGNIAKYCGAPGFKEVSDYEWIGEAPTPGGGGSGNTGNGVLTSGLGDFTIENQISLPSGLPFVWEWSNQYNCAKATGYVDGNRYLTDSYLVSPEIDLGDNTTATIDQALNYLNGGVMDQNIGIYVREGASGTWNKVSYTNPPAGNSFTFVTSEIDLSAYKGKKIQVGFRYQSTEENATTWEIKNFVVGGKASGGTTPSGVMTVAEAIAWLNAGNSGNASAKGYITNIKEIDTGQYGNATYYIADQPGGTPTITVYRGYYLNGDKFSSSDQIKVGDLVVVEGNLELYGNYKEPEFTSGNKLVSINDSGVTPAPDVPTPSGVMTVAEALAWLDAGNSGNASAKGYITNIKEIDTGQYGNATYYIADQPGGSPTITVYRGYYLNGDKFTSSDQIKVGDLVVVEGKLELYGNYKEPEFTSGSKLVSINGETPSGPDTPTPDQPTGETAMFNFTDPTEFGYSPAADETEIDLTGATLTSGIVTMNVFDEEGASTKARFFYGSGNSAGWTFRFYKSTGFTVSVPEGYQLTGIEFNGTNLGKDWNYSNGTLAGSTWTPATATNTVTITKTATGNNPTIKTMTVYYTDAAGIDDVIIIDDSEAVYYNLQGVKVTNPERGIFVKVANGKAVKVVK